MARNTVDQTSTNETTAARRPQARAVETRQALLDAALTHFAEKGFEASSTRAIAEAAGTFQPQINYYFDSKEELWRATVDHLFTQLDDLLAQHADAVLSAATLRDQFAGFIRALVAAAAELPELNRIMVLESTSDTDRLAWIVETHTKPRFEELVGVWRLLQGDTAQSEVDDLVFYYSLIGATSLAYVAAPEARRLGGDPTSGAFVEAHADAVVRMFLPEVATN